MKRNLAAALFLLSCAATAQEDEWPKTLTVCDVLQDRLTFDGKMVAIRGVYVAGVHGAWLEDENCPSAVVAEDYTFANEVWLESASCWNRKPSGSQYGYGDVKFQEEPGTWDAFGAALRASPLGKPPAKRKVRVTILGQFITMRDFSVLHYKNGSSLAFGFYVSGSNEPGLLIVKSISTKDLEVEALTGK